MSASLNLLQLAPALSYYARPATVVSPATARPSQSQSTTVSPSIDPKLIRHPLLLRMDVAIVDIAARARAEQRREIRPKRFLHPLDRAHRYSRPNTSVPPPVVSGCIANETITDDGSFAPGFGKRDDPNLRIDRPGRSDDIRIH